MKCNKCCLIHKLIDHMVRETGKIFEVIKYNDNRMIYHDTLSLFAAAEYCEYIRRKR